MVMVEPPDTIRPLRTSCQAARATLEAGDLDALEQHQVERDLRNRPRRVAHRREPSAEPQGAQCRLREIAADGIDDDVGALRQSGFQSPTQVAVAMVEQPCRPVLGGRRQLLVGRRHCRDLGSQQHTDLHRGEPHATTGAQDDQLFARLQPRHRSEHVVRRPVRHAERRGDPQIDPVRQESDR
jgi:hypothetical protein